MRRSRLTASCLAGLLTVLVAVPAAGARTVAWQQEEAVAASNLHTETVAARPATRFVVRPGDSPVRSGERTERVASVAATGARAGVHQIYRWSTRFPAGFAAVPASTWNIFTQWHGSAPDGCHPNVALQVNTKPTPAVLRLQVRGGGVGPDCTPQESRSWDFAPLVLGRWQDFVLDVGWSDQPGDGFVQLTLGGRLVVPRTTLATLYTGERAYLKQGFYRAPSAFTSTIIHSAVTVSGAAWPRA
jgi:hypothetical protein